MAMYIVTRAFQHRGTMWRSGQPVELSDAEAAEPFVAAHVRRAEAGEKVPRGGAAANLTNGTARRKPAPPARALKGEASGMDDAQLRAALLKIGVPVPPNADRAELERQYAWAREAAAGSAEAWSYDPGAEAGGHDKGKAGNGK